MIHFILQTLLSAFFAVLILKTQKWWKAKLKRPNWKQQFKAIREKAHVKVEAKDLITPKVNEVLKIQQSLSRDSDLFKMTNTEYSIHHTRERLQERYGIFDLTHIEYNEMVLKIKTNSSTPVLRLSTSKVVHRVWCRNQYVNVVYSKSTAKILTALGSAELLSAENRINSERSDKAAVRAR